MRYWNNESTYILSVFDTWLSITIDVYDLLDNTKIVDNLACTEVWTTWVYKYSFSNNSTNKKEFLWIMKSSIDEHSWKIVLWWIVEDRFLNSDRTTLENVSWMSEADLHTWLDNYANKDSYKATNVIATNMRWTDNANTVVPDNTSIAYIKTKTENIETLSQKILKYVKLIFSI